ncbi:phosphotriesterase family protein [Rhodococcus pyridinivorans]
MTTVLGAIPASELGVVLPHEHLIANATAQWKLPSTGDLDELLAAVAPFTPQLKADVQMAPFSYREAMFQTDLSVALDELAQLGSVGDTTVCELSIPGIGRDPAALKALSALSGINIVMGCGEYVEFAHSPYIKFSPEGVIRDVFLSELNDGVGRTGIKPGIIGEIGTSNTPTPDELKVLRGAALAQLETGVAINIHRSIFPDPLGTLPAIDEVLRMGVDPAKVIVSHVDERPEPEFALEAAKRGIFVELDTFGMEQWATSAELNGAYPQRSTDHDRYVMIEKLLHAGYLDQVLISHDICMKPQFKQYGGWGLTHLTKNVVPRLRARGVSSQELRQIREQNPMRALAR